ncbi:flagellar hook-length control protein FliK [Thermomonas brevis]|uniref:Flagellar hook-length control protein FliK n=1 Tax=Thermomonas brevis TaxID=215691 RepID=A0A7G9QTL8_9GAMM|nr:flagellar hook-length control protein FliK [Thermomonas brevis]QNN46693.1 flagellar hook-length control protein FliK [Thermomonas brevis]
MMGNPGSLPLPTAPAAGPAAATGVAAATAARPAQAGLATEAGAPADTEVDAGLLFDLLLGAPADAAKTVASVLAGAGGGKAKSVTAAGEAVADAVDPLAVVLAQMPQLQTAPQPQAAASAANAAAPVVSAEGAPSALPLQQAMAAAAAAQPAPAVGVENAQPAAPAAAASGLPLAATESDRDAAPVARFVLPQADAAKPAAPTLAPAFALAADDGAQALPRGASDAAVSPVFAPLQAVQAASAPQPATAAPVAAQPPILQQPADPAAGYDDRFGSHVALLAGQRIGQAEIRVVPEHLGAIDIRLHLDGSDVRAEFHSAQPEVRQALEASLPRLREMLGQHGLQLSHAGVGQGQTQKDQGQQGDGASHRSGDGLAASSASEPGSPLPPDFRRARGLLDVYA